MLCPRDCGAELLMMERSGIEIDYCPKCRGVWLDRGELDKILERSATPAPAPAPAPAPQGYAPTIPNQPLPPQHDPRYRERRDYDDDDDDYKYRNDPYYKKKRKKDWLGDLFDF